MLKTTKQPRSRLEKFMLVHGITPEQLAEEAAIDLPALQRLIAGDDAHLRIMQAMRIRDACGRLAFRQIGIAEVFDVD